LPENSIFSEGEIPAICVEEIAPNLSQIGVMLPYAPLLDWIATEVGKPLVATSGNVSNSPIIYTDEKAIAELSEIADFVLTHNRPVGVPQDDSVVRFSTFTQQKIVIRRSRGASPQPPPTEGAFFSSPLGGGRVGAFGAELKSTFALTNQNNLYISQYLGDLESYETQQNYEHTLTHFLRLLNAQPEIILTDKHPNYFSTQLGEKQAELTETPVHQVQHHIAHFAAVLGENNLLHSEQPVLGVIWDGTGLGDDGQIWGGEFFKYAQHKFLRCYHFDYFDFLSGDKMPKEPRLSALAATFDVPFSEEFVKFKFSEAEWRIYRKMLSNGVNLQTSSVGRIFDAVASLLGFVDQATYEGEAAMFLENVAKSYFVKNGLDFQQSYFQDSAHYYRIPTKTLMQNIIFDLKKGLPKEFIAAKFHYSLAHLVRIVAKNLNIQKIAFSGGVFQNEVLVDLLNHHLNRDFQVFFHQELSPNDENISFGQVMYFQIQQKAQKAEVGKEELVAK
jgi:hydrogenase maturation protein HypF